MKPINEMTLPEMADFFEDEGMSIWATRLRELHEQHRWIPVGERLPTKEDGPSVVTINKNMKCCITLWHNIDKLNVPATYWRSIEKPEGV